MRVSPWTAGLVLCAALVSPVWAVTLTLTPPPKVLPPAPPKPAPKAEAKVACPCDCPKAQPAKQARAPVTKRRRYTGAYYHYAAAAPFHWYERHQESYGPATYYGPPAASAYEQGLHIDNNGWSGGVGTAPEGGGGGGFVDGYGQVHFPTDVGNGPTYNSYNQSFQFNPSQPGPFQNRLMGGFAPRSQ